MSDLISRQDAIEAIARDIPFITFTEDPKRTAQRIIGTVPSAEPKTGRDCTDFVRWLMDEVMDEENWQLNAVANGEIICRKLKKLGMLDVVDGYYVETQKTGKWIYAKEQLEIVPMWECSCCKIRMPKKFNYCPNCGAKIFKGGDSE